MTRIAALRAWLRGRAHGEPGRRRLAWGVVALVLVAAPFVFNLERQASYSASLDVFPRSVDGYPPVEDPAFYRPFLSDGELAMQMFLNVGARPPEYSAATIRLGGHPRRLVLSVSAGTPVRARDLVNALGPQLAGASQRQLAGQAAADAVRLRARLGGGVSRRGRRRLERELRVAERLRVAPVPRVVLGSRASPAPIRGWADKLADALPGALPARSSPLWAALAGLLVVTILWLAALALFPPGRQASGAPPA